MVGTPAVEVKSDNCLLPQESTQIKHRPRRVATSTHITRLRELIRPAPTGRAVSRSSEGELLLADVARDPNRKPSPSRFWLIWRSCRITLGRRRSASLSAGPAPRRACSCREGVVGVGTWEPSTLRITRPSSSYWVQFLAKNAVDSTATPAG